MAISPPPRALYQPDYGGGDWDAVVAKFNAAGSNLIYATFLGGEGDDRAAASPWIAPATPMSPAGPPSPLQQFPHHCRGQAAQPNWQPLQRQCLCHQDQPRRQRYDLLHLSGGTNTYIGDSSLAPALPWMPPATPTLPEVPMQTVISPSRMPPNRPPGAAPVTITDAFVTAYNPTATDYLFSTYLGGSNYDFGAAIAVFTDRGGHSYVHVTGTPSQLIFPPRIPSRPTWSLAMSMPL